MSHKVLKVNWFSWHLIQSFHFWKLIKTNKQTSKKKIKINKGVKFPKKLWCSVGGRLQQGNLESSTELKCKLATVKSFKASVSSVNLRQREWKQKFNYSRLPSVSCKSIVSYSHYLNVGLPYRRTRFSIRNYHLHSIMHLAFWKLNEK